jgi:hypothetical protein
MVFKSIRDSLSAPASTWAFNVAASQVIQDHPAYIPHAVPRLVGGMLAEHLTLRRYRHIVQDRPSLAVCWADIPELYVPVRRCPEAWQQYWQQPQCSWSGRD